MSDLRQAAATSDQPESRSHEKANTRSGIRRRTMIEFDPKKPRVVVSCQGDILVKTFSDEEMNGPIGTEWILLGQGEQGEIGREDNSRKGKLVNLNTCEGILIGIADPRSCKVFIEAFEKAAFNLRYRYRRYLEGQL
jgi:hypothetical protein